MVHFQNPCWSKQKEEVEVQLLNKSKGGDQCITQSLDFRRIKDGICVPMELCADGALNAKCFC